MKYFAPSCIQIAVDMVDMTKNQFRNLILKADLKTKRWHVCQMMSPYMFYYEAFNSHMCYDDG